MYYQITKFGDERGEFFFWGGGGGEKLVKLMNQNVCKCKNLQESSKSEHLQFKTYPKVYRNHLNQSIYNLRPIQKFRFPPVIIFPAFWAGGKNLPNRPERSMVVLTDIL